MIKEFLAKLGLASVCASTEYEDELFCIGEDQVMFFLFDDMKRNLRLRPLWRRFQVVDDADQPCWKTENRDSCYGVFVYGREQQPFINEALELLEDRGCIERRSRDLYKMTEGFVRFLSEKWE